MLLSNMVTSFCGHYFSILFGIFQFVECIISLELLQLHVPEYVALGTRASLSCHWALAQADVLYSVKWYKDGKEFFRHVPRDSEPCRKFLLPGVDVENFDSSGSNLVLSAAVSETTGRYRCEVSGERPLFHTVSEHADMVVVVLPNEGPEIKDLLNRYQLNDQVQVNCTSGRSRPACQLSWYINGEPAPTDAILRQSAQAYGNAFETTSLQLKFKLTEEYLTKTGIKVKCLATLAGLYWRSNEKSALVDRMKISDEVPQKPAKIQKAKFQADDFQTNFGLRQKSSINNVLTPILLRLSILRVLL